MAGSFETGTEQLTTLSDQMIQANESLQEQGQQLAVAVDTVQSAWKGEAADSFRILMEQYGRDFDTLNKALFDIAEQIAGSSRDYAAQEATAAEDISTIMRTLEDG